ncbi:hypothetical protein HPB48_013066 [Haemaphysalis longicornis]|uniref:Uncharacterized protein n=1 Tax=Haemaphysalis longicornis TaxID=44386 RepID=A0A9J6GKV7_HAELO|nr:hypothetical protein HPB48_013066 [Haemaphysalis longicornis]
MGHISSLLVHTTTEATFPRPNPRSKGPKAAPFSRSFAPPPLPLKPLMFLRSQVCQQRSSFKFYEWAEAVIHSSQSRMYMFDDETTIVNKVKKAHDFSPNTCISLYRADLDDYGGTCNEGSPFLRVAAVHNAVFSQGAARPGR